MIFGRALIPSLVALSSRKTMPATPTGTMSQGRNI
ncbi:hypothetical protein PtrM4_026680 [Pyrenophora tritici-repentis]|uniref:Uncharacterized protein n=1 Tax=Pyrenophora tritici-repentis TaxID=45151 RepID=A0A834S9D3_9PLEO|nr:hypothetical protein PtrM4_026680 [Pyrenophora tritici-repentis]KAI0575220.1 hypothetical protein Alg215_08165 [Pyrenophora tritici-repentis]